MNVVGQLWDQSMDVAGVLNSRDHLQVLSATLSAENHNGSCEQALQKPLIGHLSP